MRDTGIPGSPPPAFSVPPEHVVGVRHGTQAKEIWLVGEGDIRGLIDAPLAASMWRITVFGHNVRIRVCYGTKATKVIDLLHPPVRLAVPGQVQVFGMPIPGEAGFIGGHAEVTLTPVTSGCCEGDARYLIGGAQAIPDDAVRFRAVNAAVVNLGGTAPCALTAGQSIPLINGSSLTSGDGYVEFDT